METSTVSKASPLSVGLKYGLILSLLSIAIGLVLYAIGVDTIEYSWVSNLINGVLAIVLLVLAHKAFKEQGNGFMSYGQGLGVAMIMTLVYIVLAGIWGYVFFNYLDPQMLAAIWEKAEADMEAQGQSEEQIEMALGFMRKFFWGFFVIGMIFWGLVLGLIVTIFTQKKEPETAF